MNPVMPYPRILYPSNPYPFPMAPMTQPLFPGIQNPTQSFFNPPQVQMFQNPIAVNQNLQNNSIQQNTQNQTVKVEANNPDENENKSSFQSMEILTKYKDIYVPTIFMLDYNDTSKNPFNLFIQNQAQQQQQQIQSSLMPMMNNFQNNQNNQNSQFFSKYFNYGYNFEQWKKYVNKIRSKFDELNDLVKSNKIKLPEPDNVLEYLMELPSDYGGLGDIQNDQNYENVKFFDPKDTTKNGNKDIMSLIKFEHEIWFPLEPNQSSLNKNFNNGYFINNINPSVNNFQHILTNPNSATVSKSDNNQIGNNSNIKTENENKAQ